MLNNRVSLLPPPLHNFLVIWSVTPLAWSYLQFSRLFGNQLKTNTWLLLEYCPLSPSLSVYLPRVIPTKQSDLIYRIRLFFNFSSTVRCAKRTLQTSLSYRVFIKYCVFFENFKIFPDSGLSLFSLAVSVCTHTRQVEHQRCSRTDRVQKNHETIRKKHNI